MLSAYSEQDPDGVSASLHDAIDLWLAFAIKAGSGLANHSASVLMGRISFISMIRLKSLAPIAGLLAKSVVCLCNSCNQKAHTDKRGDKAINASVDDGEKCQNL